MLLFFWILSKLPPPLPPNPQLFLDAKNDNLSDIQNYSLSNILLKLRPNTCFAGHVYNLKKSSNYWHFGGNRLHLLTKNALMKRCQKNWAGPSPPLIWTKSKRTAAFFWDVLGEDGQRDL